MVTSAPGRTRAMRVAARTCAGVTVPAWMSRAPPLRSTSRTIGVDTHVKDRQLTVMSGIAQSR